MRARPTTLAGGAAALGVALLLAGCASTGATFGSGVGDAWLERPPYQAGRDPGAIGPVRIGHLPVAYQRGGSQAAIFDPAAGEVMTALLEDMTAWLDSQGTSVRLVEGGKVGAVAHAAAGTPPDVRFGCEPDPDGDCAARDDGQALGRGDQAMKLAVGRPSPEWTEWMARVLTDTGTDATLVITLEVGQYLLRQEGWRGTKVLELGTAHTARLPWLTSLETPVSVLQLTGALVGSDGKALRIGAEGLVARRTPILVSAIGGQALITDEEVESLLTARREDLPGRPLVWQEGLQRLVEGLTGRR